MSPGLLSASRRSLQFIAALTLLRGGSCFRAPAARLAHAAPSLVHGPARAPRAGPSRWRMLSGGGAADEARSVALAARLSKLRALMAAEHLDALIVPSDDPHLSEYPPECFNRREFVSGFTGSAGTVVVTATEALCWTDSRYFLQAEMELSAEWTLMRQGQPGVPELTEWLATAALGGPSTGGQPASGVGGGGRFAIGYDPLVHSLKAVETMAAALAASSSAGGLRRSLQPTSTNLVDQLWGDARPPLPSGPARPHPMEWAGESAASKLGRMRALLGGADAMLVAALDEIGWLLNLRGTDLPTTPCAYCYCLLSPTDASVFIAPAQVTAALRDHLDEAGVRVRPYDEVFSALAELGAARSTVLLDSARTNSAAALALTSAGGKVANAPSPPMVAKARKNEAELAGMLEAHLRDSAALCAAFAWLQDAAAAGEPLDEHSVGVQFGAFRRQQPGWLSDSFPIIVGAGRNGAVIHYRADEGSCAPIGRSGSGAMVLIDSGGQYDCGTTDVTRTLHLGTPSRLQRLCFTRVLKGNIALDSTVFPEGTPGFVVDVLARRSLWQAGYDYPHGTGHGVGAALNVHEGPQSISARYANTEPLCAGMVLSNEPGFYDPELGFGIRIENLLTVVPKPTEYRFGGKQFLGFEQLTHVPIQTSLLAPELLSAEDVAWLDAYHARVRERVLPRVSGRAREWLLAATEPLDLAKLAAAAAAADEPAGKVAAAA